MNDFFHKFNSASWFINKNVYGLALLITNKILTVTEEFIRSDYLKQEFPNNHWYAAECCIAIVLKQRAHKNYQNSPTPENSKVLKSPTKFFEH